MQIENSLNIKADVIRKSKDKLDFKLSVNLNLKASGVTAIFGVSGCGKTTLLRCVAGLLRPDNGYINIAGDIWQDDANNIFIPVHKRPLGFIFQQPDLFNHLNVRQNLEFGLKRVEEKNRKVNLDTAIDLLGISHLLQRRPENLSGGEKQRVAIARSIATSPKILLMDEPLAALDAARRNELLPWFERLSRELNIPILYVTHSLDEVIRLADDIVLMNNGAVSDFGAANKLITKLDFAKVQGNLASSIISAKIFEINKEFNLIKVKTSSGLELESIQDFNNAFNKRTGDIVKIGVRASDVSICLSHCRDTSILNIIPANIIEISEESNSPQCILKLDINGDILLANITKKSLKELNLIIGQDVYAQIKAVVLVD